MHGVLHRGMLLLLLAVPKPSAEPHTHMRLHIHCAGIALGAYESSRFKSKKSPTASKLATVDVVLPGGEPGHTLAAVCSHVLCRQPALRAACAAWPAAV